MAAHALRGLHQHRLAPCVRIVPLEREVISDSAPDCPIWARWDERRRIRELLAAEANTAWLYLPPHPTC